jgi:hypothetical protein
MGEDRPLLLIDVDGVLNPYAASRRWLDSSDYRKRNTLASDGRTYPVWLNRAHGPQLLDLAEATGLELVWCTTWEHSANLAIGPRLGLPDLPVIEFARKFSGAMIDRWKFGPVLEYAGDRPLAWFDDDFELQHEDCAWFRDQRGDTPTLLQLVDPHHGLRERDIDAVRDWAAALRGDQPGGRS